MNFLPSVLPISTEVNEILLRILDIHWNNRISVAELRRTIKGVTTFYADDVVFEGSMARCSWEASINITGGSQPEDDSFSLPSHGQQQDHRFASSRDSSADMVFAAPSRGDSIPWAPYPASRVTWGAHSGLRTDSPSLSRGPANFLTRDDRRTPSFSPSVCFPAFYGPYGSTQAMSPASSRPYGSTQATSPALSRPYGSTQVMTVMEDVHVGRMVKIIRPCQRSVISLTSVTHSQAQTSSQKTSSDQLLRWLSPSEPSIHHNIASKTHHNGTAHGLFRGVI